MYEGFTFYIGEEEEGRISPHPFAVYGRMINKMIRAVCPGDDGRHPIDTWIQPAAGFEKRYDPISAEEAGALWPELLEYLDQTKGISAMQIQHMTQTLPAPLHLFEISNEHWVGKTTTLREVAQMIREDKRKGYPDAEDLLLGDIWPATPAVLEEIQMILRNKDEGKKIPSILHIRDWLHRGTSLVTWQQQELARREA